MRKVQQKLINYFQKRTNKYSVDNFHWVLTIPALWGERARDMMREAAYMVSKYTLLCSVHLFVTIECMQAGLCSTHPKWDELLTSPLRPSSTHTIPSIKQYESNPERLSLVYEPDAAAAWCKQLNEEDVRTWDDRLVDPVTTDNFFLTIDVGGGTIDVTAHQVLDGGRMKRVNIPHGEVYGGTIVNQAFETFLEREVVHDCNFSKYLSGPNKNENAAELFGLVYSEFEKTKIIFAENNDGKENSFMVQLPFTFTVTYQSSLKRFQSNDIEKGHDIAYKCRTKQLELSSRKIDSFLIPNIKKLHECITRARDAVITEYGDKFEIFYLVGGFGGCKRLVDEVEKAYKSKSLKVLVPTSHDLAVVRGACVYYDHQILSSADATYGFAISSTFDPANPVHAKATTYINDDGVKKCDNLFQPVVQIGQELRDGQVFVGNDYTPPRENATHVSINIYSTEEEYVNFIDKDDRKKLHHSAELTVDVSDGMHLPRCKRLIDVLFDFNGIEIKVYARFRHNEKRVNASIDFLSTLNKFDNI